MSKKDHEKKENIAEEAAAADSPENTATDVSSDNIDSGVSEAEKLSAELSEEKDRFLRLSAEYDNFRKRSAKERLEVYSDAAAKTLTDLLPVYDNFERALACDCSDENFKKGVDMIFKQLSDYLTKQGVEVINPVGEEFNPEFAQAVNHVQDDSLGENIVSQVFQKGFKLGNKVIRHAMVIVANP